MDQNLAKTVYETACSALDHRNWKYRRHDEDLALSFGVRGDDLPMDLVLIVNPKAEVVSVLCALSFKVSQDKRAEAALAVAVANNGLINGSFDYNLSNGEIRFRVASTYRGSLLGEDAINYMVTATTHIVDLYNDKFLMISKGMWNLEQFVKWENERNG